MAHTRVGVDFRVVVPPWDEEAASVERGDHEVFAPQEKLKWQRVGDVWTKRGVAPTRLRVGQSRIDGAGQGLFSTSDMEDGEKIGRMHGLILATGSLEEVENDGIRRAETRSIALRHAGKWALVHVEGVFGLMNHDADESSVHVSEGGWVEACRAVESGDELTFDYGELFGGLC